MNSLVHRYRKELGHCRQRFQTLDLRKEKGYLFKFTTFSANMQNILPEIPANRHEALFRELLLQQVYTNFDQQCISANDLARVKGPIQQMVKSKKAHIYCTFHLGSYRLLTSYLFRQGVDVALMVGSSVFHEQGESFYSTIDKIRKQHNLTNSFRLLDAEQPSSTLQMVRELRAGTSLVIFIDGMTSTTGINRQEDKELQVRLGNNRIWIRKGIGFLSHVTRVPIVPVMAYREKDLNNVLSFLDPIQPDDQPDRETYSYTALQSLFNSFWDHLVQYPGQWEGWNYIHNFLDQQDLEARSQTGPVEPRRTRRVVFNEDRYTICDLEEAPVLFDRRLYITYEISTDLRDFLLQVGTIDSPEEVLGTDMYVDLLSKQIVI